MTLIILYIRIGFASLFGGIATVGILAFALPMAISVGRFYLLPITLLLAPVMLAGVVLAILFGPLAQAISVGIYYDVSLHGFPNDDGITLQHRNGDIIQALSWAEISRIVSVVRPPITVFRLYLTEGSYIELATLAIDGMESELEHHGIGWISPDKAIFYANLDEQNDSGTVVSSE